MKTHALSSLVAALFLWGGLSLASAGEKSLVNVDGNGTALQGYDPVAYFTENRAVRGDGRFNASYEGGTYYFSSVQNRDRFQKDPATFVPQYGGYCAYGVMKGKLVKIDPEAFAIVDGKLLLQYSKKIRDKFNKDVTANVAKADQQWAKLSTEKKE